MAVPKRRTSKMKKRLRKAGKRWKAPAFKTCPECSSTVPGHIACPTCGQYRGRQVIDITVGE